MNKQARSVLLSLIFILWIVLAACAPGQSLIGKWETTDDQGVSQTIEFKSDGAVVASGSGVSFEGTYEIVDSDTLTLSFPSLDVTSASVDFVRIGGTLTLTPEQGPAQEYHKAP